MAPSLIFEKDGQRVSFSLTKDEVTIGRHPENDLVLDMLSISRKHARIMRVGEIWRIHDRGSLKGTRLNDLDHTDQDLKDGDVIFLGNFPMYFRETELDASERLPSAAEFRRSFPAPGRGAGGHPVSPETQDSMLGGQTVVRSTVDFSSLAAAQPVSEEHEISVELPRLQRLLEIVTQASAAVLSSRSTDDTFRKILDLVFSHLPVERGCIMLLDGARGVLVEQCVRDESQAAAGTGLHFSRTIADKVIQEKVAVLAMDALADSRFAEGASVIAMGIRSAMAAPLWRGDEVEGLIYVDSRLTARAFDNFDLDLLSALGNHLAVALEQSRLQEAVIHEEMVRRRLERYHSPAVVKRIASGGANPATQLMAEEREVTILFADVVGFTQRCEHLAPREIAELLNRYFSEMAEMIFRHEGTLDKFIGDCVMCAFGAPIVAEDHARRAVEAALDMRDALERLNAPLPENERLQFRVGLHSGSVVAGDIGSIRRSDYTVLGATVNIAARLESTVARPGQIIVSDVTREAAGPGIETRSVGPQRLKGIRRELRCYEVLGRKEPEIEK